MKFDITCYFNNKKIGPVFKADIGGRAEELEGWVVGFEGLSLPHFVQILPQVAGKVDYESMICKAEDHKAFYSPQVAGKVDYESMICKAEDCKAFYSPQVGGKGLGLKHVLLGQLVLLHQAHIVLVRDWTSANKPSGK